MKHREMLLRFFVPVIFGMLSVSANAQDADSDALAKELANPGGSLSSMNNKFEFRWYDGDLPGAEDQTSFNYTFQPVLPFGLENGDTFIVRPAFTYLADQPYFDPTRLEFDSTHAFGDIGFDLLYSFGNIDPYVFGLGVAGSIPTGTDDRITSNNWILGPSALIAQKFDWGIAGLFAFHQVDVAGNGAPFETTSLQPIFAYSLGDGWTIGNSGTVTYNWKADSDSAWTVPIGVNLGKTTTLNGQPIKFSGALEYNVIRPEAFTPEWKFTFTVTPVVKNPFVR